MRGCIVLRTYFSQDTSSCEKTIFLCAACFFVPARTIEEEKYLRSVLSVNIGTGNMFDYIGASIYFEKRCTLGENREIPFSSMTLRFLKINCSVS